MMFQTGLLGLAAPLGTVSKVVLLILFFFSVTSWAIILHKWRAFRTSDREDQRFRNLFERAQERDELRPHARRLTASPAAAVFLAVMDRLGLERGDNVIHDRLGSSVMLDPAEEQVEIDRQYLSRVVAHIMQEQISKQELYLPFLATTGNITPFIGLLGTVMGIIDAFAEIGKQGTASISAVAPGVAEALVATAAGLFTAIPAVIAYNYYLTRIRRMTFRVEAFSIEFLNSLRTRARHVGTHQ